MPRTLEQLQAEIDLDAKLKSERTVSDKAYSIKIVEKIVFWFCATLALGVIGLMFELLGKVILKK